MLRNAKYLIVAPVLLAAWLTFTSKPVTGLPLDKVAMYQQAPQDSTESADAKTTELVNLN